MEITVNKFDLLKELTATQGVVERKTTIPILSNFLFEATVDELGAGKRPAVVVTVNEAGRARGLTAGALVLAATGVLGGRGGGKDDVAQGGGTPLGDRGAETIAESFRVVRSAIADIMETSGVL